MKKLSKLIKTEKQKLLDEKIRNEIAFGEHYYEDYNEDKEEFDHDNR